MKQYRQHRQTNEQTRTTEYSAPVCNTYLQHRQTDNRTRTTDILATDLQVRNCVYNNTIRLVPEHVMSIFRHGYFAVVGWFCCFTSQVNSYGHCGTVSSPNHTFSWAGLNKRLTSNLSTYFRL